MENRLIVWDDALLFAGQLPDIPLHHHSASAICVALDQPFQFLADSTKSWTSATSLFVPPDFEHALRFNGAACAILCVEAESQLYRDFLVKHRLDGSHHCSPIPGQDALIGLLRQCERPTRSQWLAALLKDHREPITGRPVDQRIALVLGWIKQHPAHNFTSQELAAKVHLSPGRLSHLFREQVGLSLRRYRVWHRLRQMVLLYETGHSLTVAALVAGFSDAAHFSNSCRNLLGIKPTDLLASRKALAIWTGN